MTQLEQQKLMYNIFGIMMTQGHFDDEQQMIKELKAVHYLLGQQEHLTPADRDNCLLYFFREYGKGCTQPLSDTYIRQNLIPAVKHNRDMDLSWGLSLIIAAKSAQAGNNTETNAPTNKNSETDFWEVFSYIHYGCSWVLAIVLFIFIIIAVCK